MRQQQVIILCARLNSDGSVFLWGERNEGYYDYVPQASLRRQLFAWHAKSGYGTFIREHQMDGKPGVLLSAGQAVDYLAAPGHLIHRSYEWDKSAAQLIDLARKLRSALASGAFAPVPASDGSGSVAGWRLLQRSDDAGLGEPDSALPGEPMDSALSDSWLDAAVKETIGEPGAVQAAWQEVAAAYPAATELAGAQGRQSVKFRALDELDWREAVGYETDQAPFRIALRLVEPEDMGDGSGETRVNPAATADVWRLQPVLVDKELPSRIVGCTSEGEPLPNEQIPNKWLPYLVSGLKRATDKLRRLLPLFSWELNDAAAWTFLDKDSVLLRKYGYTVYLPGWLEELQRGKPKLYAQVRSDSSASPLLGMEQLMQFDWKMAIGDAELGEAEFNSLLKQNRRLVQIDGRWVPLDPAWIRAFKAVLKKYGKHDGMRLSEVLELHLLQGAEEVVELSLETEDGESAQAVSLQLEVRLNERMRELFRKFDHPEERTPFEPPAHLEPILRPYQSEGASWLLFLRECGFGACLADDMGLGKTLQFIAYLSFLKEKGLLGGPALLICPTSVLGNWQKELKRFAPELEVGLHYGPGRAKGERFVQLADRNNVLLTSYALAHLDAEELTGCSWSVIALDEAQNIKNPHGKQSTAIRKLEAAHRIALTGTPVENRLTELWSIYDFLNPGYLGSLTGFQRKYGAAIEKNHDEAASDRLQKLVRPFLLRRMKKDPAIQLDLPDKNEAKMYVTLTTEQGALYEHILQEMMEKIDKVDPMERRGLILAALTKLKQVCDHPALFLKEQGKLGKGKPAHTAFINRSNKLQRLVEMVEEVRSEGEKCLIFTQYVGMGEILSDVLAAELGEPVRFLHGSVGKEDRDRMVARFQADSGAETDVSGKRKRKSESESYGIFVLSLKAGGTGLNLTAANHVFHYDRWWNPAVEDQATDRAYRIGQSKDVAVHKFVTLGTLEERVDEMIERKQELRRRIVGSGENWITELSTDELKELFALRKEWVE